MKSAITPICTAASLRPPFTCNTPNWEDGSAEFYRRELPGVRDIQRIFGVDSDLLRTARQFLGAANLPGAQTAGRFNVSGRSRSGRHQRSTVLLRRHAERFQNAFDRRAYGFGQSRTTWRRPQAKFQQAAEKLRQQGGGTISIYYHPCEFVHREFWDGVNFSRGANPPRSEWKLPPVQTAEEIERNYRDFEQYTCSSFKNNPAFASCIAPI